MWPERESAQPRKARFLPAAGAPAAGENAPKTKKMSNTMPKSCKTLNFPETGSPVAAIRGLLF
jgi:hypothetical protein